MDVMRTPIPHPYRNRQQGPLDGSPDMSPHAPEPMRRRPAFALDILDDREGQSSNLASEFAAPFDALDLDAEHKDAVLAAEVGWAGDESANDVHVAMRLASQPASDAKLRLLEHMASHAVDHQVQEVLANTAMATPGGERVLSHLGHVMDHGVINAVLRSARRLASQGRHVALPLDEAWRMALVPGTDNAVLSEVIADAPGAASVLRTIAQVETTKGPGLGVGAIAACRALQGREDGVAVLHSLAGGKSRPLALYAQRCLYDLQRQGGVPKGSPFLRSGLEN